MNIAVQTFPTNIFANMFNFRKRDLFELDEVEEKEPVKVDFSK
jgi:LemA protein